MKYRVELTRKAEADAEGILAWFAAQQAVEAGSRWLAALMAAVDTLESHPTRCPFAAEAELVGIGIRELLFGNRNGRHRVLFEIQDRAVLILHIRHSARDHLTLEDLR